MLILGDQNFPSKTYTHASNFHRTSFPEPFFVSPTLPNFPQTPPNQKTICRPKNHQKKSWQEILGKTQTNATEFQCMRFPNSPQRSPNLAQALQKSMTIGLKSLLEPILDQCFVQVGFLTLKKRPKRAQDRLKGIPEHPKPFPNGAQDFLKPNFYVNF